MNRPVEREVADVVESTTRRLDRIVEQLREIHVSLEGLRVSLTGLTQVSDDHETRLRRLESMSHRLRPVITFGTFALGAAVSAVMNAWLNG